MYRDHEEHSVEHDANIFNPSEPSKSSKKYTNTTIPAGQLPPKIKKSVAGTSGCPHSLRAGTDGVEEEEGEGEKEEEEGEEEG